MEGTVTWICCREMVKLFSLEKVIKALYNWGKIIAFLK